MKAAGTPLLHSPNLIGNVARPLRYRPEHGDFVTTNGAEFFNRALFGGNTAFRVDGGDKPEFVLLQPARGGNLRLGVRTAAGAKWLNNAAHIETRYRPGELLYEIRDASFGAAAVINVEALGFADTEGLILRVTATGCGGAELFWACGGATGRVTKGDIGTEKIPIGRLFQLQPEDAAGNQVVLTPRGFALAGSSQNARYVAVVPPGTHQTVGAAEDWDHPARLLVSTGLRAERPLAVGVVALHSGEPLLLSIERDNDVRSTPENLAARFDATRAHFAALRSRVRTETPDPYLDAGVAALNIVGDALWDSDAQAIMHGSIAWRVKLLGWRGPYALDDLGWHERARQNIQTWVPRQNAAPIPAVTPGPEPEFHLSRDERGLHSNGDLSGNHYDMNMVFMDAVFRHLLWTGDVAYARELWPVIQRYLAWEKRLFRREYGPAKLPLYESYLTIWASDGLYYSGGGTAHASAYIIYANRFAARIAALIGADPKPYAAEADAVDRGLHRWLWMQDEGSFAEWKDWQGMQTVHRDYGLWNFYHTIDEEAASPREAWSMAEAFRTHLPPIPVTGPGVPADRRYHVYSETDWMPYRWSINNVVLDENMHTALALWQAGHSEEAYTLAKSAMLVSQYMGLTPGNVGTMTLLDVYRRESQSDFGDGAGAMSRALIEGLFGIHPDALAQKLTLRPGFPADWNRARIAHPDVAFGLVRDDRHERWDIAQSGQRFKTVTLKIPARFTDVKQVLVAGRRIRWSADPEAIGRPMLVITTPFDHALAVEIDWAGEAMSAALRGNVRARPGEFFAARAGAFRWWAQAPRAALPAVPAAAPFDWSSPRDAAKMEAVDLGPVWNDRVTAIFAEGKYLSPRAKGVSLSLPWQGIGTWDAFQSTANIDDRGLRAVAAAHGGRLLMPNGVAFATPQGPHPRNIAFVSHWDNYPRELTVPVKGRARHLYLLMAGSTNHQQSRIDNGEVVVRYRDGGQSRLALKNPDTWWPIEQDYFIDDYQFRDPAPLPPRINLQTGEVRLLDPESFKGKGGNVPGGAATALHLPLDPTRPLQSVTVRALANEVVIGLMCATLERP